MTALLALERASCRDTFTAARLLPAARGVADRPRRGERMFVCDLMRGLRSSRANDAAVTLAQGIVAHA